MTTIHSYYNTKAKSLVQQIKDRLSILDVAGLIGVDLTRRGNRCWGLCPIHSENTPSFSVNPETNRFQCYGCNQGGDQIDLYALVNNLSNREAIMALANHLGIPRHLTPEQRKVNQRAAEKRQREREREKRLAVFVDDTHHELAILARDLDKRQSIFERMDSWLDPLRYDGYCIAAHRLPGYDYLLESMRTGSPGEQLKAAADGRRCLQ